MAKTLLQSAGQISVSSALTVYITLADVLLRRNATEAYSQITHRTAGTLSNMRISVPSNTIDGDWTLRTRKGGANGNQVVTIPASTTGEFTDTTNTDSVTAGDSWNYSLVMGGASGSGSVRYVSSVFDATSDTVVRYAAGVDRATAGNTRYSALAGARGTSDTEMQTEANAQAKIYLACTWKHLMARVTSNTRGTDTVVTSRVNGANGAQTVTYGSGVTGVIEDTTNSDAVASGDLLDWATTTGAGAGAIAFEHIASDLVSTAEEWAAVSSAVNGVAMASTSSPTSDALEGGLALIAEATVSETLTNDAMPVAVTASNLSIYLASNTGDNDRTERLRKNGADTAIVITIPASTSGRLEDTTNTASFSAGDEAQYRNTGVNQSGNASRRQHSLKLAVAAVAARRVFTFT